MAWFIIGILIYMLLFGLAMAIIEHLKARHSNYDDTDGTELDMERDKDDKE